MADKLDIRVSVDDNNQTVSKFSVSEKGHVVFHNDAAASLEVAFGEPLLLCQGNTPQPSLPVPAGQKKQLKVCNAAEGQSFKYTATVSGAGAEDPIVIIEKAGTDPGMLTLALVAAAAVTGGALLGYGFARRKQSASARAH